MHVQYPTLCILQNQTLDGHIMNLTGILVLGPHITIEIEG